MNADNTRVFSSAFIGVHRRPFVFFEFSVSGSWDGCGKIVLDLFQAAALGLGNAALDEDETGETDGGVEPESDGRSQCPIEHREGEGEHEAGDPQGASGTFWLYAAICFAGFVFVK